MLLPPPTGAGSSSGGFNISISTDLNTFKDKCGRWRSRSLFIEFAHPDYPAIFTLEDEDKIVDGITYISAKRKYLEYKDPYEHNFATSVFGTFPCWEAVCSSPDLKPHIEGWRNELQLLLRSLGIQALLARASAGDVAAAKHLATFKANPDPVRHPGRPRKAGDVPQASHPSFADDHAEAFARMTVGGPLNG